MRRIKNVQKENGQMILGLDISTSCTGWCILDRNESLVKMGFIQLSKTKCLFEKAQVVKEVMSQIHINYEIDSIRVEEDFQSYRPGFSSAKTLSTLSKFNGIVSYICFEEFCINPKFINVNQARKSVGIKIKREKDCGKSTKQQVLDWVCSKTDSTSHIWPVKILKSGPRKGQTILEPGCYDMADAYVIAVSANHMNI